MSKKNKGKPSNNQTAISSNQIVNSSNISLSQEDKDLLDFAKELLKEGDAELKTLIEAKAKEADEQHKKDLEQMKRDYQVQLELDNASTVEKLDSLKDEIKILESKKCDLKKERTEIETQKKNIEIEKEKTLSQADKDAKKRLENVYKDEVANLKKSQKELEDEQKELENQKKELEDAQKKFQKEQEIWKEDCDDQRDSFKRREERLIKKEEEYNKASPEVVDELNTKIESLEAQVEAYKKAYLEADATKNQIELIKARSEGLSKEQLQQEVANLTDKITELQDKYSSYDDLTLAEMNEALNNQPKLLEKITMYEAEIARKNGELARNENVQLEYSQLHEQLKLLRTLNDHLRTELSNTKKMLETSTGDVCQSLTEIDAKTTSDEEVKALETRNNNRSTRTSLYEISKFIREFAASQEKPLFYSSDDMNAFIAGLASSPFAILQGMSGTGKTSLPMVFTKAIMGEVNIVAVESSWRDRNELLGYYNDFSRKYTAKEFTKDLYKANTKNYEQVPYFIVLDEMNLSRVEYYFADFLSVLEKDPKEWAVQLVDTDLRQPPKEITPEVFNALNNDDSDRAKELKEVINKLYPDGKNLTNALDTTVEASDKQKLVQWLDDKNFKNQMNTSRLVSGPQLLVDGKTLRIPQNVWFIGTANKDESTFEITDKVYDRAQVMNFTQRAKGEILKRKLASEFISYDVLDKLFKKASNDYRIDLENNRTIIEVDDFLKKHFRISFGNRILDQIKKFVPVFIAASTQEGSNIDISSLTDKALDYQITNKVLRKLEYVEMTNDQIVELEGIFKKHNLSKACEFLNSKKGL